MSYPKQVRCIDASPPYNAGWITVGQVYTATGENPSSPDDYMLDMPMGIPKSWRKDRFEDVVDPSVFVPFEVECIDNNGGQILHLTIGSVYKVMSESEKHYYLAGIAYQHDSTTWYGGISKTRFIRIGQQVAGDPTVAVNDHICPGCGNDRCSKSEKSCWKCGGRL